MKTLFSLLMLAATLSAGAQSPDAQPFSTPPVPEVVAARDFAKKFIDTAFFGDYRAAEKMMTPEPPYKGSKSTSEFRKARQSDIKSIVDKRNELGKERVWDKVIDGSFLSKTERPPEEQFASFTFWCTYPNGTKSSNRVVVMKKNGQMWVEYFGY